MDIKKYMGLAILVAVLAVTESTIFETSASAAAPCAAPCGKEASIGHQLVYNSFPAAFTRMVGGFLRPAIEGNGTCVRKVSSCSK